jgi:4-hydroxy-2-oxoheptanedioate aldolase
MSLGGRQRVDLTEPNLVEALDAILAAARRHGRVAGLHTNSPDYARRMIDQGFRFVTVMTDTALLAGAAQSLVAAVRGDTPGALAQPAGPY